MNTWKDWEAGKRKQLNQFYDLQIFGKSIFSPTEDNAVIL